MTVQHELLGIVLAAVEALHQTVTAGGTSELDATRLRELGLAWGQRQRPLAPLVLAVRRLTESTVTAVITGGEAAADVPRLVERLRRTGVMAVRELLSGFRQAVRGEDRQLTAADLLWGGHVPPEPDYAVIALRCDDPGTRIDDVLTWRGRLGAVSLCSDGGGFVLAPAHDEKDAVQLGEELREDLAGATWLAVAWRPNTEIGDAGVQASVVLDLVTNLAEPPGVYGVEDVVVEYALMRDTAALVPLLALIAPVVHQQPLRTTLEALVATAGNRSKAASILNIHRSTLDYRLNRVGRLTGCVPTSARGLQTLAAALALHGVVHQRAQPCR